MNDTVSKTCLFDRHRLLNAKIVPFANYLMPVNYPNGLQSEYDAVRNKVGMFDVSHMGQIFIEGKKAIEFLQYLTVNNVEKMNAGSAQYNLLCNDDGTIIDDIIVYMFNKSKFLLIVNASNIQDDYNWILKNNNSKYNIMIYNDSKNMSIIAVQGPDSRNVIAEIFKIDIDLKFYTFKEIDSIIISRTGYTGELGFEIVAIHETIKKIWDKLLNLDVIPCGLAVRDILRMEMKYCLYGNDISLDTNPLEAGLNWVIDFSKNNYIGKEKIDEMYANGPQKKLICFLIKERAIPRKSYKIISSNKIIGEVSSGTFSLGLNKGIGLAYIDVLYLKKDILYIEIRKKLYEIDIIKPPFIKNTSLHN